VKLHEIVFGPEWEPSLQQAEALLDGAVKRVAGGQEEQLSSTTLVRCSSDLTVFVALRDGKALGFVELKPTTILDKNYLKVVRIFIKKEHRGTRLLPGILTLLRTKVTLPVVLGDSDDGGGVLSTAGKALVFKTFARMGTGVKLLNTETGEVKDLESALPRELRKTYITLLFECRRLPLRSGSWAPFYYIFEDL
jgi:hypothetical protein